MPLDLVRYPFADYAITVAPDDPGVYVLWEHEELTYIGKAQGENSTIRSRLLDRFYLRHQCGCRPTHYSWQLASDPERREHEMLLEHLQSFEALPRCNKSKA
jgi:hypothetical protein